MSVEDYGDQFYGERLRHLEATRDIRQAAWDDAALSGTERIILGITGSRDILNSYESLIERLDRLVGEPVISVDSIRDYGIIQKGRGGVISGVAKIITSGFTDDATTWFGRVGATLRLEVPVDPIIAYANGPALDEMAIFTGHQVNGDTVLLAAVANCEEHNETASVNKDFRRLYEPSAVFLGRSAIRQSAQTFGGLIEVLEAIDKLASD